MAFAKNWLNTIIISFFMVARPLWQISRQFFCFWSYIIISDPHYNNYFSSLILCWIQKWIWNIHLIINRALYVSKKMRDFSILSQIYNRNISQDFMFKIPIFWKLLVSMCDEYLLKFWQILIIFLPNMTLLKMLKSLEIFGLFFTFLLVVLSAVRPHISAVSLFSSLPIRWYPQGGYFCG